MTEHPTAPPRELVQQLCDKAILHAVDGAKRGEIEVWLIQEAFRAGADQELEATLAEVSFLAYRALADRVRAARRPKPPSLKQQALEILEDAPGPDYPRAMTVLNAEQHALIRRALEALPDD